MGAPHPLFHCVADAADIRARRAERCLLPDRYAPKPVAINPRGTVYTPDNVKESLATRNLMQELRDEGTMSGGPPPLSHRDRKKFANAIDRELTKHRRDSP